MSPRFIVNNRRITSFLAIVGGGGGGGGGDTLDMVILCVFGSLCSTGLIAVKI